MAGIEPKGHPSLRGILLREMIAASVRATGGDIISLGQKFAWTADYGWKPPPDWHYESVDLPTGAHADYLVPPDCRRKDVAVLQLHGGAYTLGFLPVFRRREDKLSRLGGNVPVCSLDYRIAPEHPYPAALDDAAEILKWLENKKGISPGAVLAIGESAGAGLALALSMRMRDSGIGALRALVLMSPWTDLTCSGNSYADRYFMDPMFGRIMPPPGDEMRLAKGRPYAGGHDMRDPYISPVFGDFKGLPPMLIHVGEYEMLFDDAAAAYEKARSAGVDVRIKVWPGMFHAFQLADSLIPDARAAWREIGEFMREKLSES